YPGDVKVRGGRLRGFTCPGSCGIYTFVDSTSSSEKINVNHIAPGGLAIIIRSHSAKKKLPKNR
ncbi:hypothetical protein ABFV57_31120, partial [Pseudomonas neuropathica]|uniref:hypothetical protein n=1 Tax=Pseudomonas neuropathica TaxID=2730425 RepID=UPI0034D676B2